MPGKTIGTDLNYGYPGNYARSGDQVVRTRPVKSDSGNIAFGDAVILNVDGTVSKADATATAANFAGIAAREIKGARFYPDQDTAYYAPLEPADIFERGAVSVVCRAGTPVPGGAVYLRTTANAGVPTGVVGGLEAAADSGKSVALANCKWGTAADANGVAELVILTRTGV
jgi:hypothetical protein